MKNTKAFVICSRQSLIEVLIHFIPTCPTIYFVISFLAVPATKIKDHYEQKIIPLYCTYFPIIQVLGHLNGIKFEKN